MKNNQDDKTGLPRGSAHREMKARSKAKRVCLAANEKLPVSNQQFNAANQELSAMNQKLTATCELEQKNEELASMVVNLQAREEELRASSEELRQYVEKLEESRKELRTSEIRYRRLFETAQESILILNADTGIIEDANPFIEAMLGYPREELLGKKLWDIGLFKDIVANRDSFIELQQKEHIHYDNLPLQTKDGRKKDVEFISIVYPVGDRKVVQCNIRDITERKRAEEKLKEQAGLLDEASDAIILRDLQHNILYWNKSAERIYGWRAEEVIGKNARDSFFKYETEEYEAAVKATLSKGFHEGEFQHVTKTGKRLTVNKRMTLIRAASGEPKAILTINTDITEKKSLQAQFLLSQRMESLGTLAGGIAHDLNNVLAPILLEVDALKGFVTDQNGLNMLEILKNSAERGSQIVKQILGFARGTGGKQVVFQPRHIIKETIVLAKETFPKSITVKEDIPGDLWPIQGDTAQFHQVLMNLSVNARDAMPQGGILTVAAENTKIDEQYASLHIEAKPGKYLMLIIQDTGTGMPPEIRERIFDPFFTTKDKGKGTGLGLSTVHSIVKRHGGFINLYSKVGKGTVFKVYFPVAEADQEAEAAPISMKHIIGNGELVLVVDDEESILSITSQILEVSGYRTLTARDGLEAVAIYGARGKEIAVVLTDHMMPNMDGSMTIRALRKLNPDAKIIISSGFIDIERPLGNEYAVANAFIAKPYTADKLLKTLQQVLQM